MCFTRRPAPKTARTMEATPIILGSLGASPGSMERFMIFLLANMYIYIYIYIQYGKLKKWEIYGKSIAFIKHGLGTSGIFHVHDSRSPKFDGPYEYGNWGLPTSRHAHMMNNDVCVCVQKLYGYLKMALWVWKNVVLKFWTSSNHKIVEYPGFIPESEDRHWKILSLYI